MNPVNFATYNVHLLASVRTQEHFALWLTRLPKPTPFVLLQENHLRENYLADFSRLWEADADRVFLSRHCGILVPAEIPTSCISAPDTHGQHNPERVLSITITGYFDKPLTIVSVYAPVDRAERIYWAGALQPPPFVTTDYFVLEGDFNNTPDPACDRAFHLVRPRHDNGQSWRAICDALPGVFDVAAYLDPINPTKTRVSRHRFHILSESRIDLLLAEPATLARSSSVTVQVAVRGLSDHSAVVMTTSIPLAGSRPELDRLPTASRGLWRFNSTMLNQPGFAKDLSLYPRSTIAADIDAWPSPIDWWEWALAKLAKWLKRTSSTDSHRARAARGRIVEYLLSLRDVPIADPDLAAERSARDELAVIENERAKALSIRASFTGTESLAKATVALRLRIRSRQGPATSSA